MATPPPKTSETFSFDLIAAGKLIGLYCWSPTLAWLDCKAYDQTGRPEACRAQGDRLNRCSDEVIKLLSERCQSEWLSLADCFNGNRNPFGFDGCRAEEAKFYHKCVLGQLLEPLQYRVQDKEFLNKEIHERWGKRYGPSKQ